MDKGAAVLLMAAVGGLIAFQAPINAGLSKETGSFVSAFLTFALGTVILAGIVAVSGRASGISEAANAEWYYLIGGALGAVYVLVALVLVDQIGAGGVAAATVTGQLVASVVLDRIGVFGLEETPLTWERMLGVGLLLAGTFLIVR